jgi:hypothetical protein
MTPDHEPLPEFDRSQRTVTTRCDATPPICDKCSLILEADGEESICRRCRRRWLTMNISPCPRLASVAVQGDRLCPAHAVLVARHGGG